MKQKILGQFFTNKNIFKNKAFLKWYLSIPSNINQNILEPFAGKNGLIDMLHDLKLIKDYSSFDIEPQNINVKYNDSLVNFPLNFKICITNPPFLAKNVATRKKIPVIVEPYTDLYEKCLDLCLKNCDYVAAIVPESFIVSPFFKHRLCAVISLGKKALFDHTEHPVCLALFNPENTSDFEVYQNNKLIGLFLEKEKETIEWLGNYANKNIKFHDKNGGLALFNIDATNLERKIHFDLGETINSLEVNHQSRLRTRIEILTPESKPLTHKQFIEFIKVCNKTLTEYRKLTQDIFLTSFKGLRSDGRYRRRLDYTTARLIVAKSYFNYFFLND